MSSLIVTMIARILNFFMFHLIVDFQTAKCCRLKVTQDI